MDCKATVHTVNRHGSRGPRPAPPPKPSLKPGASAKLKGSPPALPRNSPVARVKPMKHESLDTPNAQVSSSPGKTPPPLPVTPPKGSPQQLSPKLPLKIPLKPPAVPPCKPKNGLADQDDTKVDAEGSLNPDTAEPQLSPKASPRLKKKSPLPELKNKDNDVKVSETADPEKLQVKPQRAAPTPPSRPPAPVAKPVPRPVPRKRSIPSVSSPEPEGLSAEATPPKPPVRPPIPKQRSVELVRPTDALAGSSQLQKSASVDADPKQITKEEPTSPNPVKLAVRKGDFSQKLAGLLGQGPRKTIRKTGVDSGDEVNDSSREGSPPESVDKTVIVEAKSETESQTNTESLKIPPRNLDVEGSSREGSPPESVNKTVAEVKSETVENQTNTGSLKIPPRKKKNKKSRDSSPASPSPEPERTFTRTKEKSPDILEKIEDISVDVDQNANDIHPEVGHSSAVRPKPFKPDQGATEQDTKMEDNEDSSVNVRKLRMGFANLVTKGLQQQLTMKSRPSVSPRPRSQTNSSGHTTPDTEEEKVPSVLSPEANPEHNTPQGEDSIVSGEKPVTPLPKIKLPLLPPKIPAKPDESEGRSSRTSSDGSNAPPKVPMKPPDHDGGKDSRSSSNTSTASVKSSEKDATEKEPPPPLPVRTAPKMKNGHSVDVTVTPSSPEPITSPDSHMKKHEKRPLPPLPSPEEEKASAAGATPKAQLPKHKNRPLPPLPVEEGGTPAPRPARKAPGPPPSRKRSKSTPGPIRLILEEFRPRSQDVDDAKNWTAEDEKKFQEMKQVSEELKKEGKREGNKVEFSLQRQSSREGKPVFNPPPPPPVDETNTAERGCQTPVEEVVHFDFEVPSDVIPEEDEHEHESGDRSQARLSVAIDTPLSPGAREVRKPCRPAPPPPPPKPKPIDESGEEDYLVPKQRDSFSESENTEEYSYVSSEYYPDEEQKQRSESNISSQHIYEFVDTSLTNGARTMSIVSGEGDNTYDVPDEVLMRHNSTTSSHTYQKMDTPQAPPRPKRQTMRQKSMDLLSVVVPVGADVLDSEKKDNSTNSSDDDYIYPEAEEEPVLADQNIECESTYDISNIPFSPPDDMPLSPVAAEGRWDDDSVDDDENNDYILPGGELIESESTYDISSTPVGSPVKVPFRDSSHSSEWVRKHHSLASSASTGSDNHDYFDMMGVTSSMSSIRHTIHDMSSSSLVELTASQEELWREGQSDYSESASEQETGDDDDDQKPKKPKVFYIAREIMSSEEVFVDVLRMLNVDFRKAVSETTEHLGRPIIPAHVLNDILHYLPQLESFNSEFLEDLHKRVDNWEDDPRIADIFVRKGPFLRLYISYIKEFDKMITMFEDACKKYPTFQEVVRDFEVSERCASLAIRHYMLKPIQRIPQYKMLLQDYLNHLTEDSPDYNDSKTALEIVSEIATHANESMREGDNFQKLLEIQNSLQGNFEVVKPGRTLIKMGMLNKLSRKEAQPRMLFLFNDVLLYTTPLANKEYKLNHVLSLAGMKACKPVLQDFQNEFSVISIQRSFTICANTPRERDEWLVALTEAIEDNACKRSTFEVAKTNPESMVVVDDNFQLGLQAPVWVPDARVTMCMLCTSEFTVTWRRHHCRACGRVICGACSDFKAPLKYLKNKSVRVCRECFEKIMEHRGIDLEEGQTTPTAEGEDRRPRKMSENFKKSTKWVKGLHIKRPSVLKEVQANDAGSDMSGYMKVLRGKKWKKRWFVIKRKVLYTYKASEDAAASRSAPLLGYEIKTFTEADMTDSYLAKYFENVEPGLVFQVSHKGTDPIVFRTESSSARDRWIEAIKEATDVV